MTKDFVRFSACYGPAIRAKKSGWDDNENMKLATASFNGLKLKDVTGDAGKSFGFLEAWQIPQKLPKAYVR